MVKKWSPGHYAKQIIMRFIHKTGLIKILELKRPWPGLLVLNYHRVIHPEDCVYDHNVISTTPDQFYEQVKFLKSRFYISTLNEVQDIVVKQSLLRKFQIMLSFDDGYLDNYQNVYPILKSHGVPGSFFLPTSFIGKKFLPWWDQIAYIIKNTKEKQIKINGLSQKETIIDLDKMNLNDVISRLFRLFLHPDVKDPDVLIELFEKACGLKRPVSSSGNEFMNWEQVKEMAGNGMAIGSHSHTHKILSKLSREQQYLELKTSRDVLNHHLNVPIQALAYPVGTPETFTSETMEQAERAGYQTAFSYYGGVNCSGKINRFNILRTSIEMQTTLTLMRVQTACAAIFGKTIF